MAHGKSTVVKAISGVQVCPCSVLGFFVSVDFCWVPVVEVEGTEFVVGFLIFVQTVRFKNELERNITIKLGYANAKIYKCEDERCPRPMSYKYVG